jgi:N6-L-threonylcarbamoyladenine synthase
MGCRCPVFFLFFCGKIAVVSGMRLGSMKDMIILGIETSCDDTSAAVIKNGREVLSNVVSSQVDLHSKYGGIVPEIASRKHVEMILPIIDQALADAGIGPDRLDVVGVTYGPGLVGSLLVGISAAKAMAFTLGIPLLGINHIEGHISAGYLQKPDLEPPFICLVVSGGHSNVIKVKGYSDYDILGMTRDDAAGEAFDKVARIIGLGYPGGPLIDRASLKGNPDAIEFPRVYFNDGSLDFSFSGVKTSVLNYVREMEQKGDKWSYEDVAASFQRSVVDVLVNNTMSACEITGIKTVTLAGGVAANSELRKRLYMEAGKRGLDTVFPKPSLCTDNAAMIACAAYHRYKNGERSGLDLNAVPGLSLLTEIVEN